MTDQNIPCTYCGRPFAEAEMSAEHVFPLGLASIEPVNPLLLRTVCTGCNSTCGRHVDAPFLKSWSAQATRVKAAMDFSDLTEKTVLPLLYFGEIAALKQGTKICEFWNGPTGERIYHFHEPYEQDYDARVAVGRPQWGPRTKFDSGFVCIAVNSATQPWISILINSCFETFPDSHFYFINANTPPGKNRRGQHFTDFPTELSALHTQLAALNGQTHRCQLVIFTDAPDRFLAKFALGFGALFLQPEFTASDAAAKLRSALWTRSADERQKIMVRGRKFLGEADPLKKLVDLPGCHVVAGLPVGNHLMLIFGLAGMESHAMEVTNDRQHWAGTQAEGGLIFVISPGLKTCIGPLSQQDIVTDFLSSKDSTLAPHPALSALRTRLRNLPPRPPI
jgi:hypothetical protein